MPPAKTLAFLLLLAHDPGAPNAPWFNDLKRTSPEGNTTYMCCGPNDCVLTRAELRTDASGTHWWAFISRTVPEGDGTYHIVPDDHILKQHDNPTGEAVVCWYQNQVWCFVEPPQT